MRIDHTERDDARPARAVGAATAVTAPVDPTPSPAPAPQRSGKYDRPLRGGWDRFGAWMNMVLVDHGFFRLVYLNFHKVGGDAFRSAQPAPNHFRRFAAAGVRTVVSLRGGRNFGSYPLEKEACAANGMVFEEITLRSRAAPTRETLEQVAALLERIEYPVLFHCKAGADRAGLMSALYLLIHEKRPVAEAKRQLSLRYGHVRQGKTGMLDMFLEAYEAAAKAAGGEDELPFMTWVRTQYDPAAVTHSFRSRGWADFIVDRLLDRE